MPDLAVLDEGGGDEEPVVGRFLDERDDRGETAGGRRQVRQARVIQAHRDLRGEVLELVAGQAEFREDDQIRALLTSLAEQVVVGREVDLQRAEPRRDLGERDLERLHAPEHTRWPPSGTVARPSRR